MQVKWNQEDGSEPITFEFDPEDVMSKEAEAIEKVYGEGWEQWLNGLRIKEVKARRVLLWWHLRQTHKALPFKDTPDFRMRQLKVEMNVKEIRELQDRMARTKMEDDVRERLNAAIEVDLRDAMAREGLVEGDIVEGTVSLPKPQ